MMSTGRSTGCAREARRRKLSEMGVFPSSRRGTRKKLNLGRRETAILCVLLLRGPQTLGEIKGRTERVYEFADLDEVEMVLQKLAARDDGALTQKLPATSGMKEPRWAQTLGGPVEVHGALASARDVMGSDRVGALETEVSRLREEVAELKRRLDEVLS